MQSFSSLLMHLIVCQLMQPIIWLAIVGVAAGALGTGMLSNTFFLNLQTLGVAETDLQSPIKTANIDFTLSKISGVHGQDPVYKNRIVKCSFHTPTTLGPGSTIICKLTDADNDVIAEGKIVLQKTYTGSSPYLFIPIEQVAFDDANNVQNVHDEKIVVLGPKPDI